ncbi:MAG: hypothetical protein P9M15_06170 [Candidatus Electryoneaceae bacterium]|nr:hypothetical protein [Candidatus Electryoneaceae bacterium]
MKAYERLQKMSLSHPSPDIAFEDKLAVALVDNLRGTIDRLENGLVIGDSGLWNETSSDSTGSRQARIESQILFSIIRKFLDQYPLFHEVAPGLPPKILTGTSLYSFREYEPTASGHAGEFKLPLNTLSMLSIFQSNDGLWYDHFDVNDENPALVPDSTQTTAHILALGWHKPNKQKLMRRLLDDALDVGLVGEVGFRSLAETEDDYRSAHEYLLNDNPIGTLANGDMLVWTSGRLADMLRILGRMDSLSVLAELLSERVMTTGIIGGLPEAENGEPLPFGDNTIRNPVHCTSTAEYVRLMMDDIIGVDLKARSMILRPRIPAEWGTVSLTIHGDSTSVLIERLENDSWRFKQTGYDPYLNVTIELFSEQGGRVIRSVRLSPGRAGEIRK